MLFTGGEMVAGMWLSGGAIGAVLALAGWGVAASAQELGARPGQEEVVVTGSVPKFRPGALRTDIVKTEVITAERIEALNANNLNQAVDKNPGISVQLECSICNVRNINLNNLPGRFTTFMIDGVPIFSSLSTAYGLDSVDVAGIQSIDISRGAGASLIAPEALSGVVNVVTRRPLDHRFTANFEVGDFGAVIGRGYAAMPFDGGAVAFTGSYAKQDSVDETGAGISQFTGFDRKLAGIALFLGDGEWRFRARLDYVDEERGGGALGDDYAAIKASVSGNPFDWSRLGSSAVDGWFAPDGSGFVPYDDGRGGFSEIIFTKRYSAITVLEGRAGGADLKFSGGYARNEQDSFYELATYDAIGDQIYLEASARFALAGGELTAGLNYRYEDLRSLGANADGDNTDGLDDYLYRAPGAFVQYYKTFFDEMLETNVSVRVDDHNVFGTIVSPRANFLLHHSDNLSSRLSIGKGFRAPTSFFEQDHGILDTVRIVRDIDEPETSENLTYALNYSDDFFVFQASYNYNRIENIAVLDTSGIDPVSGDPITFFTSIAEPVTVQSFDFSGTYQATAGLALSLGAEKTWFDFPPGALAFSRPDAVLYASVDWHIHDLPIGHLDLFARATWVGPQDLAKFYDYANNPRFNLDGTLKQDESPSFVTIDVKATWEVSDHWALYAGVDNLTDYIQADHESLLWLDASGGIDVTHLWGPNRGRYIYAGIKATY